MGWNPRMSAVPRTDKSCKRVNGYPPGSAGAEPSPLGKGGGAAPYLSRVGSARGESVRGGSGRLGARRRGVTLLEMILASSLLVLLSSLTYVFYSSSLSARDSGMKEAAKLRLVRVVLDRMTTELRQIPVMTRDFGVGLVGDPEAIILTTRRVPRRELAQPSPGSEGPPDSEYDLVQVQYRIARHPDVLHDEGYELPLGLARIESKVPRPESALALASAEEEENAEGEEGGETGEEGESPGEEEEGLMEGDSLALGDTFFDELFAQEENADDGASLEADINWEELYAPEVHYVRFCYFDGATWWDKWHVIGENALPQLVQITIGFSDRPPLDDSFGEDEINEEFCECLNEDPVDCLPLGRDEYATVVRLMQADPLFRSRVVRQGQDLIEKSAQQAVEEEEEP